MFNSVFKTSKWSIWLSGLILILIIFQTKLYKDPHRVLTWDVQEYYAYCTSLFIYHDIKAENIPPDQIKHFWDENFPKENRTFRFTMGLSILYTPFFWLAHIYATHFGPDNLGYSWPYKLAIQLSSIFYLLLGLFFLRKILIRFVNEKITAITLLTIVFGTNLLYYTALRSGMTHAYSFALFCMFIYTTIKWHEKPSLVKSIGIGLLAGLISLIRPTNAIIILVFVFYNVSSIKTLKSQALLFVKHWPKIIIIAILVLLVWLPQMLYWHSITGKFFYYSYRDESFFFAHPQILKSLFSYRSGWLVYTPLMFFGLAGIFFLFKQKNKLALPSLLFTILNIYILSSWWCWWFVGFGNRAYIDSYAILSLPLALVFEAIFKFNYKYKNSFMVVILFLVFLNIFGVWQYKKGYIHWDGMTKEAYWFLFLNPNPKEHQWQYFKRPDYELAKQGIYKYQTK